MPQIQAGLAVVHNGSATVTCSDPTVSWNTVENGDEFSVFQSNLFYKIAASHAPVAPGGPWTLTLQTPYAEPDQLNGIQYVIQMDFSHYLGLPVPDARSSKLNVLVGRIVNLLDVIIYQLQTTVASLSGSTSYEAFVPGVHTLQDMVAQVPTVNLPLEALRKFVDANGSLVTFQLRNSNGDATNLDAGICRVIDYGGQNLRAWYGV